ncbi:MAG: tRNA (adenosine(37)-N6)-threonylcarbamoyltransferase complex ATPase subunit type 1 TsaE [Butyricicoccus sp.]|nr:tRNA (adenosine(37)-N6)-threonylcarbamoyltransferase complex ATPase subunit type 1 TsaE [Butyricicoccus pullicaecorum]MCI6720018.1 tRNA (adenosine(37)-N6)-threonylcarbamoyltransferase complex ATPase subunit type 1 TsaE [Clostridiales bacterium]MDY5972179.1 tRNA (adenosine(37)-N6)-threonylcarbamoyltransferase complex ATPase subunit type 1 TsaE [Butyricicoccus sp.]
MRLTTHSPEETEQAGADFARTLRPGDVVTLDGELGAGKTAFARGVLRGLGYEGRVTSPTFAIANEYDAPGGMVAHFDLYRILDEEALFELGFEEYLDGERILLIEWSENAGALLPEAHRTVQITYGAADDTRILEIGETA